MGYVPPEYTDPRGNDIGWAVAQASDGKRVTRAGWNGPGMWLELQVPDEFSKMGRPYLYLSPVDGALVPWTASQSDLLALDWMLAPQDGAPEAQD